MDRPSRLPTPRARVSPLAVLVAGCAVLVAAPASSEQEGFPASTRFCQLRGDLPIANSEDDERREDLDLRLATALTTFGYTVVPGDAVTPALETFDEEFGGYVDPLTGVRIPERYEAYRAERAAMLEREFDCDYIVHASVVQLRAFHNAGFAQWDGQSQQVISTGRLVMGVLGGVAESGWVAALSLWVRVSALDGDEVAFRSAGIETLVTISMGETDLLPEDTWLTDQHRLRDAFDLALGREGDAFRERSTPTGPPRLSP